MCAGEEEGGAYPPPPPPHSPPSHSGKGEGEGGLGFTDPTSHKCVIGGGGEGGGSNQPKACEATICWWGGERGSLRPEESYVRCGH